MAAPPPPPAAPGLYGPWVAATGWGYFTLWSASFWPQTVYNAQRRSVVGFSADFLAFNLIKHASYAAYNFALFWSVAVQRQYRDAHGQDAPIPVTGADVAYSAVVQYLAYERGGQKPNRVTMALVVGALLASAVAAACTLPEGRVLRFVTVFSYLQLAFTTFKYFPQMVYNFRRKTCYGWSLGMVSLDLGGSMLSFLQMVLQSLQDKTTTNFSGDPTKVGLSVLSVIYDLIFIGQYIAYGSKPSEADRKAEVQTQEGGDGEQEGARTHATERQPLLPPA